MWILDILAETGKLSSIQVAIMLEYSKKGEEPTRIVDIIKVLETNFEGLWTPKKGTIYPAVHNLHVRGFLKMHAIKPYGYSITPKGQEVVKSLIDNLDLQMETYMRYYNFILDAYAESNKKRANKIKKNIIDFIKKYIDTT